MIRMTPNTLIPLPKAVVLDGCRFEYRSPTGRDHYVWHYKDFFLSYTGNKDQPWSAGVWSPNERQTFWGPQCDVPWAAWRTFGESITTIKKEINA